MVNTLGRRTPSLIFPFHGVLAIRDGIPKLSCLLQIINLFDYSLEVFKRLLRDSFSVFFCLFFVIFFSVIQIKFYSFNKGIWKFQELKSDKKPHLLAQGDHCKSQM